MTKARDLANAGTALTSVSATELGYLDGVTSAVQTQLNAKQAVVSGVDSTEIGYLDGVTSSIQTQLNSKIEQATAINPTIVDAKGDIIAATAADTVARLAVGANDTVLTADSSTATGLKWATPASGGMTLIASGSLSGSSLSLTSISGSYKNLQLVLRNAQPSTNTDWRFRINNNTGSIYDRFMVIQNANTFTSYAVQSAVSMGMSWNNPAASTDTTAVINIFDYANTSSRKQIQSIFSYTQHGGSNYDTATFTGTARDNNAVTRIDVILDTGNFSAGTYILYGVN